MHIHLLRFFATFVIISLLIQQRQQPGILHIVQIIHHRSPRNADCCAQLADIHAARFINSCHIQQLLQLHQIFQLNLTCIGNIKFQRQIDIFQQIIDMRLLFQINRIISILQVIMKISQRTHLLQHTLYNFLMIFHNFLKRADRKLLTGFQFQKLPKRKPAQIIHIHHPFQIRIRLDTYNRRSRKDNLQIRESIITRPQLPVPLRILMHLIQQQHLSAQLIKILHKMEKTVIHNKQIIVYDGHTQ